MDANNILIFVASAAPVWGPFVLAFGKLIWNKIPAHQQALLLNTVQTVVQGTEQAFDNKPGTSAEKKAQAETWAAEELKRLGIKVSASSLDVLIESAVGQLNAAQSAQKSPPNAVLDPASAN